MKLKGILALFSLCVIVKGTWLAAIVQPVILGFGAVLTALNQDDLELDPTLQFDWPWNWNKKKVEERDHIPEGIPEEFKQYYNNGPVFVEMDGVEAAKLGRKIMKAEKEGKLKYTVPKTTTLQTFSKDEKDYQEKRHKGGWIEPNKDNPFKDYG